MYRELPVVGWRVEFGAEWGALIGGIFEDNNADGWNFVDKSKV